MSAADAARPRAGGPIGRRLPLLAAAGLAFAAHAPGLWNGFVYDDHSQIAGNPWLRDPGGVGAMFSHHFWAFDPQWGRTNLYRPLVHLLNLTIYRAAGPAPLPYHLANVLLHAAVAVLLALVLRKAADDAGDGDEWQARFVPAAAAALFAVHPVHVEPVAWVAGSPDLLASALLLASLLLHRQGAASPGRAGSLHAAAGGFYFAALLAKEMAFLFPIAVLAYDRLVRRDAAETLVRCAPRRYGPFLVAAAAYLALRWRALGGWAPEVYDVGATPWMYAGGIAQSLVWYLGRSVLPVGYHFYQSVPFPPSHPSAAFFGRVALLLAAAAAWGAAARRSRLVAWGGSLAAVTLAPVFFGFAMLASVADRYLYLPSAGACVVAAWALGAPWGRSEPVRRKFGLSALAVLCALQAAASAARTTVFRDDVSLWSQAVARDPGHAMARGMLADLLLQRGQPGQALVEAREAERLGFGEAFNFATIGSALLQLGRPAEAEAPLRAALRRDPAYQPAFALLGEVHLALGDPAAAADDFARALRLNPGDAGALQGLGLALEGVGALEEALRAYEESVRLRPGVPAWEANAERLRRALAAGRRP